MTRAPRRSPRKKTGARGPLGHPGPADFLTGGGEMGRAIAAKDWAETPLGPIESWSQSLRKTVSLCLASNFPISLAWGPQRTQIYNDGYWPLCGAKHPYSMGQDFRRSWASAWPAIGEAFESAERGETRYLENQRMFLDRNGYLEETFFTFSFSPIRNEAGEIDGLFHPVTETTARMLSERRGRTLRDLAARTAEAVSVEEVCRLAIETMAEAQLDVPFALVYLMDEAGPEFRLTGRTGVDSNSPAAPESISVSEEGAVWPLDAAASGKSLVVRQPAERLQNCGPYPEAPYEALILPLPRSANRPAGVLVAGVSPRLPLDEAYRGFYDLLASQLAAAIANARGYDEERKRAEALAELDRAKTQFFSSVSHEFRTPLTLILAPLEELLRVEGDTIHAGRDALTLVHRNGVRLLRLVNTLLDFSRMEAGRAQAAFEPVDLAATTEDFASVFRSAMEAAGIRFIVDCHPMREPVFLDRTMWEKVVLNLLSNALKFTFAGEVRVEVRERGADAEVSIRDTGTGIPKAAVPHLFERFYRVAGARGRTHEGSGIGLSLVREIVKLHGGSVSAESTEGVGTTFRITLPFGSAHLPAADVGTGAAATSDGESAARGFVEEAVRWLPGSAAAAEAGRRGRARILLADDNADMRQYAQGLLRPRYNVQAVRNGAEALQAIGQDIPDVVLSDVMMPELDGFGLLGALRRDERTRGIPVILLSARAGEEARIEGLEAGANDYLVKPFSANELLARVATQVELTELRTQLSNELQSRTMLAAADQQRRVFDAALSSTVDFVYTFDLEGRFTYVNRALLTLWQKSLPEALGHNFVELGYPRDLAERLQRQIQEVVETKQRVRDQTPFTGPTGETRHYEYIFAPVIRGDGAIEAVAGSTRDITDRLNAEAEERVRQEQQRESARLESLGLLAGGVAHDFNNLLVGVVGNASLAMEMLSSDHPVAELLAQVLKTGEQAAHLTRQMLAYSGKGKFVIETIDLSALIEDIVGLVRPSIPKKILLRLELGKDLPRAELDRGQVQQVFMNLVLNAADAIGAGEGPITVRTAVQDVEANAARPHSRLGDSEPGRYVRLEVEDTGCGMDEATMARIFDPFFSTKFIGRGLGLSAVAGIVRGHKGTIEVKSTPNLGSTFSVLFPATGALEGAPAVQELTALQGSGTVLVVDDEPVVAEVAAKTLKRYGYTVLVAGGGREAIDIVKRHPGGLDLVLLDMSMPDMNGDEVLPELRKIRPSLKILLSSGYSESETVALLSGKRLSGFIQKPYTSRALTRKVKECLES